jgi:hypothetical protein
MPRFDSALLNNSLTALSIVSAGETSRISGDKSIRKQWSVNKIEALYELAYLRIFAAWEIYLEAVFYRSLCGYASAAGQEQLIGGHYYPNLAVAEAAVLGTRPYVLWHNPQTVIDRCNRFIRSGPGCPSVQGNVIGSDYARLIHFAATRHRIAHEQTDAKTKFDAATQYFVARTYPASRPGKFLRDFDVTKIPQQRWLEVIARELSSLLAQMV